MFTLLPLLPSLFIDSEKEREKERERERVQRLQTCLAERGRRENAQQEKERVVKKWEGRNKVRILLCWG
jgi:hypothetical protein